MAESQRVKLRITDNFQANLDSIEAFLWDRPTAFSGLMDILIEEAMPLLKRFPAAGRDYFSRPVASFEAEQAMDALRLLASRLGLSLREYIAGDYLILYGLRDRELWFLSIRHHSQMGFDLREF